MPEINLESVKKAAEHFNLTFADDDTDQDKLEKVLLAYQEDRIQSAKQTGVLLTTLTRYEKRIGGSWQYEMTVAAKVDGLLHHLEHAVGTKQGEMDSLREKVIENLLGIRVLVNAILNGNWTHTQKNTNLWAIGEFIETAIDRLRESDYEFGQRFDPFVPRGSRRSLHYELTEAEKDRDKYRAQVTQLTALLEENGHEVPHEL